MCDTSVKLNKRGGTVNYQLRRGVAIAGLVAFSFGVTTEADAAQSVTAGKNRCTVTAVAPTLKGTTLTGSATVLCTMAGSVAVLIGVVEPDQSQMAVSMARTPRHPVLASKLIDDGTAHSRA